MSCVAGFLDRPIIILRSLKLKSSTTSDMIHNNPRDNNNDDNSNQKNDTRSDWVISELSEASDLFSDDYEGDTLICDKIEDFLCLNNPNLPCVLLKAVLVVLGIIDTSKRSEIKDDKLMETEGISGVKVKNITEKRRGKVKGKDNEGRISYDDVTTTKEHSIKNTDEDDDHNDNDDDDDDDNEDSFLARLCSSTGEKGRGLEIVCCSELPAGSGKYWSCMLRYSIMSSASSSLNCVFLFSSLLKKPEEYEAYSIRYYENIVH